MPTNLWVTACIADGISHVIQYRNIVSQCTLLSRYAGVRTEFDCMRVCIHVSSDVWAQLGLKALAYSMKNYSASCPFTTTCTAINCFKALAHHCTQWLWYLRNPIHPLHAPVSFAVMFHQKFQVPNWPQSSMIVPTNNSWPPTTPQRWRPPTPPLPSPISTSLPPVVSLGGTAPQPHSGSVQDGFSLDVRDLEPDNESDSWILDDDDSSVTISYHITHTAYPSYSFLLTYCWLMKSYYYQDRLRLLCLMQFCLSLSILLTDTLLIGR